MSEDITGKKASTVSILFGKSSATVREARSKLFKNLAVSEATGAVALGVNIVSTVKNFSPISGIVAFTAPQLIGGGISTLIGESTLPVYTELSQAHAAGQKISAEAYAELVGKASPELKARGGSSSVFAKELGKIYAAENASPAQIMREAANGKLVQHVKTLIAANEAAKATSMANGSHVAALQKPAAKTIPSENKPVVGNHTKQLVASAGQANHALSGT